MTELGTTPRTLRDLGWPRVIEAIAGRTQSPLGNERARALPFCAGRGEVQASLAEIDEARQLLRRRLPMPVGGVEDIRPSCERACKGAILDAPELQACAGVARAAADARRFVTGLAEDVPLLAGAVQRFVDLRTLASRINGCLEPSGNLRDDASVELAEHRTRARSLHGRLEGRLGHLLNEPEFVHKLQDNYYSLRNDRYVVPVKASFRGQVPGIVHNASQSGQTIFVEPEELIPLGNELTIAQALASEEERRILSELSSAVAESADALVANAGVLAQLDVIQAAARMAEDLGCEAPELVDAGAPLLLKRARHPLLLLQGKKVVPNTLALEDGRRALIISGPNAGGKTVSMATVGTCLLMARAGLPIPADLGSQVPLVLGVSCSIGDAQDLSRDLSTFSAHLEDLAEVLRRSGPGWVCLIDEIAGGTDPVEGAALATATLEALVDGGARVVVTTHLDAVKAAGVNDPRFVNARFGLDPESLAPTFAIELGAAGVSSALDVAAQVGLPKGVIARAREAMQSGGALTRALTTLEARERQAESERRRLAEETEKLRQERDLLAAELRAAERARAEAELKVRAELADALDEAQSAASRVVAELQAEGSIQAAQRAQAELRERAAEERRRAGVVRTRLEAGAGAQADGEVPFEVGARVKVPTLGGRDGVVEAVDGAEVLVRAGSLRTRVPARELVRLGSAAAAQPGGDGGARQRRKERRAQAAADRTREAGPETQTGGREAIPAGATLDLRGMRADEAERAIVGFLDEHYLHGPPVVLLIHGHGTGVLRQVVREVLVGSAYVDQFRAGDPHEGGDGVTVVQLKA